MILKSLFIITNGGKTKMKTLIDISPERTGIAFRLKEIYPKIKDATIIKGMHLINYHPIYPTYPEFATAYQKLDLLKHKYPDAYIFYVDRDLNEWIISLYNHWVKHGGTLNYFDWLNYRLDKRIFETHDIINYAKNVFGNNFYLLNFESLMKNPNKEFNQLLSHFELNTIVINNRKHNASFNNRQIRLNRFLNKVIANYGIAREWIELLNK